MASSGHEAEILAFPHQPGVNTPVDGWEQAIHDVEQHLGRASTALEAYLAQASTARSRLRRSPSRPAASWPDISRLASRLTDVSRGRRQRAMGRASHAAVERALSPARASTRSNASPSRSHPEDHFRTFVSRLAPYRTFDADDHRQGAILRQLVLGAAHAHGGQFSTHAECQEICQTQWGLELEREEVSVAVARLVADGELISDSAGYRLSESCNLELAARVRASKEVESAAFYEWELALTQLEPRLSHEQVAQLREDLIIWLHTIVVESGVKAAVLLDSEQESSKRRLLEEIDALGFGCLPARDPQLTLLRPAALRAFLEYMTPIQRRYFDDLLATAHLMSVFTLDPAAQEELQRLTSGQRLYLDTNVLYALLRLRGPEAYSSTKRVLTLSRQLGYRICVTPWTATELQESVRSARSRLAGQPPPPTRSAATAAATHGEHDTAFARAFRNMRRDTGISSRDFFDLYEQVEPLLMSEGIEVVADGCQIVDRDVGRLDEQIATVERVGERVEHPRSLQEHDVKHRLLVEQLRGGEERRLSNAGFLVVTDDHALVRYADASRRHSGEAPFAVLLAEWANIVRSLTPRTGDYNETMLKLLDTPSIRTPGLVSQAEIIDAIARMNVHERYSATIRVQMLLDDALGEHPDGGLARSD